MSATSFTFGPEQREATLDVTAVDDLVDDDGESVSLELMIDPSSSNVSLGSQSTEEVLILDDDAAVTPPVEPVAVSFGAALYPVETGGMADSGDSIFGRRPYSKGNDICIKRLLCDCVTE